MRKPMIGKTQLIYLANSVHLILNTYRCLFFKLLLRTFNVVQQLQLCHARQVCKKDSVKMEKFCNLQDSKLVNHNGAKMVDVWNVNKLTEAWTKMEVAKLRTKAVQ